jgi:hypothetical protein
MFHIHRNSTAHLGQGHRVLRVPLSPLQKDVIPQAADHRYYV